MLVLIVLSKAVGFGGDRGVVIFTRVDGRGCGIVRKKSPSRRTFLEILQYSYIC